MNTINKTIVLFEKVVKQHNPLFKGRNILTQVRKYPKIFNIEHLIELTMAQLGGYEFVDGAHCDFSDGSECKTCSVHFNPTTPKSNTHRLEISGVVSPGGIKKSGPLRIVLYNPCNSSVSYYFVPNDKIESLGINYHPTTNSGRVFASWNRVTNRIPKLDSYQVDTFEDLAKA